jgi:hypothetical protein
MEAILSIVGWMLLFAIVAFTLLSAVIVVEAYYYQGRRAEELERDLGFHRGSAYPRCRGRWNLGVVSIRSLTPGGVFERAGFQEGDLLPDLSLTELFKLLHRKRGREVELVVVEGGDGPPLSERPSRTVQIVVPPAKLRSRAEQGAAADRPRE